MALIPIPARAQTIIDIAIILSNVSRRFFAPAAMGMIGITVLGYLNTQNQRSPNAPDATWKTQVRPSMAKKPMHNDANLAFVAPQAIERCLKDSYKI